MEDHILQPQSPYSALKIQLIIYDGLLLFLQFKFHWALFGPRQSARAVIPLSQIASGRKLLKLGSLILKEILIMLMILPLLI